MAGWLNRLGRAQALAGATALVLLITAVVGVVVRNDGSTTAAIVGDPTEPTLAPIDVVEPTVGPLASFAPSQGTVTASSPGAPLPGGAKGPKGLVRGPAKGKPIPVGVHFNDNEGAAAQFGVGGLPNISDAEVRAVITQVNKAGGLAGRPISPIFHRTDPTSGTFDAQGQAACETFTDDNGAKIVIDNALSPSKVVLDCLAKRKIPLVWELHMAQTTNAEMRSHDGYLYRPSMPNADRLGFIVDALNRDGFWKNARVGILRYDTPEHDFISDKIFKPRLRKLKVPVVAEHAMKKPANAGGAAGLAGESSNAVLDFKDEDVTHVLLVPTGGAIPLTFLPAAASQGYEPAYGLSSQDSPEFIGLNFPESQLVKARIVGWAPDLDGDAPSRSPAYASCKKALADAALPWDEGLQPYCDAFYLMHHALYEKSAVSPATLKAGVESLGSSFDSPYVYDTRFGKGRYDGPTQARMLRYNSSKRGWKYYGPMFGI
jgi:hypothetical protein